MRKYFFFFFFLNIVELSAQEVKMREVFCQMPDSIIPYLTENNRLDFVDFMDSHMDAEVTNLLGGKSRMKALSDQYVSLELSEASKMEMRLLPVNNPVDSAKQVVCLVATYGKDYRESVVRFYSIKWRLLPTSDYFVCPSDFKAVEASLHEEQPTLTLRTVNFFNRPANEEQKEIEEMLTSFNWSGLFVKQD